MAEHCEILTIGDELLRGELVDTNASWLAARCAELGLEVTRIGSVGDGLDEIADALREASQRCRVLLVSGGLGPTDDDRTAAAAARAAGVELKMHAEALASVKAIFARAGFPFTPNNADQAMLPATAEPLLNERGTAPGLTLELGSCRLFCMPGVPRELRWMFDARVLPWLSSELSLSVADKRSFKLFGLGESQVDHQLRDLAEVIDARGCDVSVHYRATFPENHVTVIVRRAGATAQDAASVLDAYDAEITSRLGRHLFARDQQSYSEAIVARLREAGATVALAESCTGGLAGDLLTRAPGASDVFELGVIAYADRIKRELLGVDGEILDQHGAVSQPCVEAMARAVRERAGATYGVAISGIAGPGGGTEEKPVGTVHFALSTDGELRHLQRRFPYDRARVKLLSAYVALWLVWRHATGSRAEPIGGDEREDALGGRWSGGTAGARTASRRRG